MSARTGQPARPGICAAAAGNRSLPGTSGRWRRCRRAGPAEAPMVAS